MYSQTYNEGVQPIAVERFFFVFTKAAKEASMSRHDHLIEQIIHMWILREENSHLSDAEAADAAAHAKHSCSFLQQKEKVKREMKMKPHNSFLNSFPNHF